MMTNQTGSVSVIGAGIIGSWTALHLAEAGVHTTLVEQFPLPHTRGSSHGLARVLRWNGAGFCEMGPDTINREMVCGPFNWAPLIDWRDPGGLCSAASGFPIIFNARLTGIYGLPSCEYRGLVKMLFHGGPESNPDTRDLVSIEPYVEKVSHYIREYLPCLDEQKPAILESCMYTMSPDGFPIIDRIDDRLVVGCGFSGSGFKHSPATGRMLAALALGQEETVPEGFRADRYALDRFDH